jgi:hypothetical protein
MGPVPTRTHSTERFALSVRREEEGIPVRTGHHNERPGRLVSASTPLPSHLPQAGLVAGVLLLYCPAH